MRRFLIILLFFVSGFTGLVYEIVWIRIFGLIFGNTTLALSTVLSAYMLGMVVGSYQLGKRADQFKNYLKVYALLEFGIAITALLILLLRGSIDSLSAFSFSYLHHHVFLFNLIKFFISFLLMFPATFLMGGTLPVVTHLFVKENEKLGAGIGFLYGINTVGAVAGTLVTGFFLIKTWGVNQTLYFAIILDLLIAAVAFYWSFSIIGELPSAPPVKSITRLFFEQPQKRIIFIMVALSGFTALSYEVIWNRLLVFTLTTSVYAFSVMLSTFLIGIALGSFVGGKIADRVKNLTAFLGWIEIGIGIGVFFVAYLFRYFPQLHQAIFNVHSTTSWTSWNAIRFLEAFSAMFIPTLLMGISFPVAGKIVIPQVSRMSAGVGLVYSFNTLGAVLGSFLSGFVLIVLWGTAVTTFIMIFINLAIGSYLLLSSNKMFSVTKNILYCALVIIILALVIVVTPRDFYINVYGTVEKEFPLIAFKEGVEGTVTVHQSKSAFNKTKRIDIDGLNIAGTSFMLKTLQLLQGHLPFLIKPEVGKVLQIGFGTGQTSAACLKHPHEKFELVEIAPDVITLADFHFQELNNGVIRDPRFYYTIMDGKNFLKYTRQQYDIIMNDANYAVSTSSASLFTCDHFVYCLEKLSSDGILSTWMTTDLDPEDFRIVLKTFHSVFPYSLMWMAPNCLNKQVVLMGSATPITIDFQHIQSVLHDPVIAQELATINILSVYDLLSCLILDSEGIAEIAADSPINSDNYPILEFSGNDIRSRDWCAFQNLAKILVHPPNLKKLVKNLPADTLERQETEKNLKRFYSSSRELLLAMMRFYQGNFDLSFQTLVKVSHQIPESKLATEFFHSMDLTLAQIALDIQKNPDDLGNNLRFIRQKISQSQLDGVEELLQKLLKKHPTEAILFYEAGRYYLAISELDRAAFFFHQSVTLDASLSGSWYYLGKLQRQQGEVDQAKQSLNQAIVLEPAMYEAYNELGMLSMISGHYAEAARSFMQSLEILDFQPEVDLNLAKCLIKLEDYHQALHYSQKAISMGYEKAEVFFTLGNSCYFLGEIQLAIAAFQQAIQQDSTEAEYYYNLGNSFVLQKNYELASDTFRKALLRDKEQPDYFNNLALSYRETGNFSKSLQIFNEGLIRHPASRILQENKEITEKMRAQTPVNNYQRKEEK